MVTLCSPQKPGKLWPLVTVKRHHAAATSSGIMNLCSRTLPNQPYRDSFWAGLDDTSFTKTTCPSEPQDSYHICGPGERSWDTGLTAQLKQIKQIIRQYSNYVQLNIVCLTGISIQGIPTIGTHPTAGHQYWSSGYLPSSEVTDSSHWSKRH